ncbi:hypothetical protein Tco_0677646 [Tanacetum coccineum]|uniref:Integrase, catalytic region, zinc finger, CCHC-type, peptidase aspartic, catalytic n=1 Tax=Tanacetum coccineum TaxID=301880 RepID=A0ABQ4XDD7_9ASTR
MMANLSKDIQCAGSDTRPPMLDRTDFKSWQQRIRLYCLGKDNGGRFVTTVKLNRGLKQSNYDQLYAYLKQHEAHANENMMMLERYNQHAIDPLALVSNVSPHQYPSQSSVVVQNVQGRQNIGQGNNARRVVAAGNWGVQNRVGNANLGGQTNTFDDDVDEAPIQDLALNEDNTMFMANLSSADLIYDEAGPSYDSYILSEVQDHDNNVDSIGEYHEVYEMQNDVQPNYIVDSDTEYTSDSNIILYEQYVKDNAVQVIQSNVSSVPNDALMIIIHDMHAQAAQCVSANEQNKVVNESLTAKLARYKEQV